MPSDRHLLDARILALAGTNGMVITAAQLRQAGIAAHLIDSRLGWLLQPVTKGVYAVGAITPRIRLRAALAAIPSAAASHRTASGLLGLPLAPSAVLTITVPGRTRRELPDVAVRPGTGVVGGSVRPPSAASAWSC